MLVAQIAKLDFRRKLLEGDDKLVQNLRLGTWTTVALHINYKGIWKDTTPVSAVHL